MKPSRSSLTKAKCLVKTGDARFRRICVALFSVLLVGFSGFAAAEERPDTHARFDDDEGWVAQRLKEESDEFGNIDLRGVHNALLQRKQQVEAQLRGRVSAKRAGISGSTAWSALGPGNIGGRVRSMVMVPGSNKLLAGSASGGIWASSDRGNTWTVTNDWMGSLSIGALAVDPNNSNVIYAGTGEGAQSIWGDGIFKSVDGGATWTQLASTIPPASSRNSSTPNYGFFFVDRIAVKPGDSNTVVAATESGMYRSTDAGNTWTAWNTATTFRDVKFDPNNHSNLVAGGLHGDVYTSNDSGVTWVQHAVAKDGRMEIAFAPSSSGVVFISGDQKDPSNTNKGSGTVYTSTDDGLTWTALSYPGHLGNQGDYDNTIWVDPSNAKRMLVAGLDAYRSVDGGVTWTQVSDWTQSPQSSHADHHVLLADTAFNGTSNLTVYDGDDGGVYVTHNFLTATMAPNGGWVALNNGLPITQFYSVGTHPSGLVIGGAQDNGSDMYQGGVNTWTPYYGGDGGFSAVDQTNANNFFGEYVYLQLFNTTDGGNSTNDVYSGISDAGNNSINPNTGVNNSLFISPFILDPSDFSRMYAGAQKLWRTETAFSIVPSWSSVASANSDGDLISAIAVSPIDPNVVWYGTENGALFYSTNALASVPTWTAVKTAIPARYVNRITIDADTGKVYVSTGGFTDGNLLYTTDNGTSWTSFGSANGLPQVPYRSLVRHPSNPNWLYLGTYTGIYTSEDGGQSWSANTDGPANVQIKELRWQDSNTLVAATYGRGMFKVTAGPASAQFFANAPGTISNQSVTTYANPNPADLGQSGAVFLAAQLPNGQLYFFSKAGWTLYDPKNPIAYSLGALQNTAIPTVSNVNLSSLSGTRVAVGYGLGSSVNQAFNEMLSSTRYKFVLNLH